MLRAGCVVHDYTVNSQNQATEYVSIPLGHKQLLVLVRCIEQGRVFEQAFSSDKRRIIE